MELDLQVFANFVHVETDRWPAGRRISTGHCRQWRSVGREISSVRLRSSSLSQKNWTLAILEVSCPSEVTLRPAVTSTAKDLRLPVLMLKLAVKTGVSSLIAAVFVHFSQEDGSTSRSGQWPARSSFCSRVEIQFGAELGTKRPAQPSGRT